MAEIEEIMDGHTISPDDPGTLIRNNDKAVEFSEKPAIELTEKEDRILRIVEMIVGSSYQTATIVRYLKKVTNLNRSDDLIVSDVVNLLFDSNASEDDKKRSITPHPVHAVHDLGTQTKDDSALAIMGPHNKSISDKEQSELQKAIEESLISSSAEKTLITSYLAALPENPEDMERLNSFPCGIHNIGQSCWFSVVAQLLFSIRKYRNLLYELAPIPNDNDPETNNSLEVKFLLAIRLLFASMDKSNKKFLNPYQTLEVVNEISKKKDGRDVLNCQQDAMEMLLRLIDWIESGAFKIQKQRNLNTTMDIITERDEESMEVEISACSPALSSKNNMSVDDVSKNDDIMEASFSAAQDEDVVFKVPTIESRVQPLTLPDDHPIKNIFLEKYVQRQRSENGYNIVGKDVSVLHLLNIRYDNLHDAFEDGCFQSSIETWIESAPKVMIFSLNRFHYDKVGGSTKVHKPFKFPENFFIDRYLLSNADEIKIIREELEGLRYSLAVVRSEIEGLEKFPLNADGETCKLATVLNTTLSFLSGNAEVPTCKNVQEPDQPIPQLAKKLPQPAEVSNLEQTLANLRKIHDDILAKEIDLNKRAEDLHNQTQSIFNKPELMKHGYQLHAIVIHEGEANMGHYWIYVRGENGLWQKMNDRNVEVATWAQIEKDAFGIELPNTSAYGLVYLAEGSELQSEISELPADLAAIVEQDNTELENDIKRYKMNRPAMMPNSPHINMDFEGNINDSSSLYLPLSSNLMNLYTSDERDTLNKKVDQLRFFLSKVYNQDFSFESATRNSVDALYTTSGTCMINALLPALVDVPQEMKNIIISEMSPEKCQRIYENYITEWFNQQNNLATRDSRANVLNFWKATGAGMHGKVHRYILVLSLARSGLPEFSSIAQREIRDFEQDRLHNDVTLTAQLHMCLYEIVRVMWACALECLKFLSNPDKPNVECYNDFVSEWCKNLKDAVFVYHMYNFALKELKDVVKVDQWKWECEYMLPPLYTIKGLVLIPFLNIFTFLVYTISQRGVQNSELQNLIEPQCCLINSAILVIKNLASTESKNNIDKNFPCTQVLKRMTDILDNLLRCNPGTEYRTHVVIDLKRIIAAALIEDSVPELHMRVNWSNIMEDIGAVNEHSIKAEINSEENAMVRYKTMLDTTESITGHAFEIVPS